MIMADTGENDRNDGVENDAENGCMCVTLATRIQGQRC
jgi:hypothetical protein